MSGRRQRGALQVSVAGDDVLARQGVVVHRCILVGLWGACRVDGRPHGMVECPQHLASRQAVCRPLADDTSSRQLASNTQQSHAGRGAAGLLIPTLPAACKQHPGHTRCTHRWLGSPAGTRPWRYRRGSPWPPVPAPPSRPPGTPRAGTHHPSAGGEQVEEVRGTGAEGWLTARRDNNTPAAFHCSGRVILASWGKSRLCPTARLPCNDPTHLRLVLQQLMLELLGRDVAVRLVHLCGGRGQEGGATARQLRTRLQPKANPGQSRPFLHDSGAQSDQAYSKQASA